MRFVPRLSVGQRLTLYMVLVVVLSGGLGAWLGSQAMRLHLVPRPGHGGREERDGRRRDPRFGRGEGARRDGQPRAPDDRRGPESGLGPAGGPGQPEPRPPGRRRPPPLFFGNPMFTINLIVGVLVALAAGVLLSRRFTRPLSQLAEAARALRAGNFRHRVTLTSDDEFGRVATSMNQMAERVDAQIEALQSDARRRQQLLADVSHELRSPVATLRMMAEAVRDGVATSPERRERATRAMVDSAVRMERLVNDLIEVARLDLAEFPLHCMPLDVRSTVADCLRRHAQPAEHAHIELQPLAEGVPVLVSGDPHRLGQILDNLLDNAISHAGEGAEVQVTVREGSPVTVTVADTGRGISPEHLPYLFDAFYRGDAARTPGGRHSGLGLRIARGLAQAHGGDLRLTSVEGQGTRAILTLPPAGKDGEAKAEAQ